MYEAFNNNVIVTRETEENKNEYGIITNTKQSNKYKVIATTENTKELQDRIIVTDTTYSIDPTHLVVKVDDIIAVCQ